MFDLETFRGGHFFHFFFLALSDILNLYIAFFFFFKECLNIQSL